MRLCTLVVSIFLALGPCFVCGASFYIADDFTIRLFTDPANSTPFANVPSGGSFGMDGLVIALDGSLYATDSQNGTILRYTAPNSYTVFASGLNQPQGLAFDSVGNLFVVENGPFYVIRVLKFSAPNVSSVFATGLQSAYGIAVNSADAVFVTEYGGGNIRRYTSPETYSLYASGLSPASLTVDDSDALIVADYNGNAIRRLTSENSSSVIGATITFPMSVGVEPGGDVIVGEFVGYLDVFHAGGGSTFVNTGFGKLKAIAVIPEPCSATLLVVAFGMLFCRRSRR